MKRAQTARNTATALVAVVLVSAACSGGDAGAPDAPPPQTIAAERPASSAELTIVRPVNGERIDGDTALLEVDLKGGTVVEQTSTELQPDEGHLHVMLDGQLVSMTSGTSQELGDLPPGEHLLQVEFVANDHAPFDPRVLAASTFEVKS